MNLFRSMSRETKLFIGLTVLYGLLAFILPASHITKADYQLSNEQYHSLLFIVRLPILAVWCVSFYGYRKLLGYARQIAETKEGESFMTIAKAMGWIAWGFAIPAVTSSLLNAIANVNRDFLGTSLIITNYLYVIASLVAFSLFVKGAHTLLHHSKIQITTRHIRAFVALMVVLGVLFCVLIATRLHGTTMTDSFNAFYMPNWLVWLTLVVPYLYAWFIGIFAALELVLVAQRTSGIIYRQALQLLALGLVMIIVSMCAFQYFRAVVPRTGHLTIGAALVTTYAIYGVNVAGSLILATGARRLKKIEDI